MPLALPSEIRSVAQSCPTLCNPMNCSTPGLPVHRSRLPFGPRSQASLQKAQGPGVCKLPKPPASRALCQAKRVPRAAFPSACLAAQTKRGQCSCFQHIHKTTSDHCPPHEGLHHTHKRSPLSSDPLLAPQHPPQWISFPAPLPLLCLVACSPQLSATERLGPLRHSDFEWPAEHRQPTARE